MDVAERKALQEAVRDRGVQHVVHFTTARRFESILRDGALLPRRDLEQRGIEPDGFNDEHRVDSRKDCVCASIGFPNYRMFYSYASDARDSTTWVVMILKPAVLWERFCGFAPMNAARGEVSRRTWAELIGPAAFRAMYAECVDGPSGRVERAQVRAFGVPSSWPTDPEAEILVKGTIPLKYVTRIAFKDRAHRSGWAHLEGQAKRYGIEMSCDGSWFKPREDFSLWQQERKAACSSQGRLFSDSGTRYRTMRPVGVDRWKVPPAYDPEDDIPF